MSFSPQGPGRGRALKAQARQDRIRQQAEVRQAISEAFADEKRARPGVIARVRARLHRPDR